MITSTANARIKQLRRLLREGGATSNKCALIEGVKLVQEAIQSQIGIEELFVSEERRDDPSIQQIIAEVVRSGGQLTAVSKRLFASLSDTESPQGVIALGKLPVFELNRLLKGSPLLVVGVGIQDPGNVGTLLRSSEAFGASAVLFTRNSACPWSPKVIRASAGSVFRLPCLDQLDSSSLVSLLQREGFTIIATGPRSDLDFRCVSYLGRTALLVGNEARGLDAVILQRADHRVRIPMNDQVDSLNAAISAAIILCEAARQRHSDMNLAQPPEYQTQP
jgi:TrmH family RNA methyltransferase